MGIIADKAVSLYKNDEIKIMVYRDAQEVEIKEKDKEIYLYEEEVKWLYNELKKIFE